MSEQIHLAGLVDYVTPVVMLIRHRPLTSMDPAGEDDLFKHPQPNWVPFSPPHKQQAVPNNRQVGQPTHQLAGVLYRGVQDGAYFSLLK
ncbi:hypothetical protein BGX29_007974 [Mortierella sp. GBA35]|nr:hypothetical protein BGX29_007974 [Mortierella sp. GBA35]